MVKSVMNFAPIGVFDSGLGGLTCFKRLGALLPNEDVIYFGDTGRVPYGSRSRETIIKYTRQCLEFLISQGVKAIIVACNTASSAGIDALSRDITVPLFEVVSAPCRAAASSTTSKRIGVIGTSATVASGAYERELRALDGGLSVISAACPLFVPLAENGRTSPEDVAVMAIAGDYLAPVMEKKPDTLILGCTHYPLLRAAIEKVTGGITLIDSGAETAEYAAARLRELNMLTGKNEPGTRRYYITDSVESFEKQAMSFLGEDISGQVKKITLE